jgi:hypothetical protein
MSSLFGSTALEVAIGLFFIYFLLSLVCSSVNEMFAGWFKLRAHQLEQGLANLLRDPELFGKIMSHPLISTLGNARAEAKIVQVAAGTDSRKGIGWFGTRSRSFASTGDQLSEMVQTHGDAGKPDYIPARTFAMALFDTLAPAGDEPITVARIRAEAQRLATGSKAAVSARVHSHNGNGSQDAKEALRSFVTQRRERRTITQALAIPEARTPQLAQVSLDDIKELADEQAMSRDLAEAVTSAKSIDELSDNVREVMGNGVDTTGRQILEWAGAVQSEQAKQAVGRALLVLIDQSRDSRKLVEAVDDVNRLLDKMQDSPQKQEAQQAVSSARTIDQVRTAMMALPESPVRSRVLEFINGAVDNLEDLRDRVETWYDDAMDRVSGVYKRQVQFYLFLIALCLTIIIGADTIHIIRTLSANANLRALVVAQADQLQSSDNTLTPQPVQPGAQTGQPSEAPPVRDVFDQLDMMNGLFGHQQTREALVKMTSLPTLFEGFGMLISMMFGWLLTAIAVSLGAPFWFDVLRRVSNIRNAGPVPERGEGVKG